MMEELFRKIFETFPEKSTIIFKGKCCDCGKTVIMSITPTSTGFGLLGGAFIECLRNEYAVKCPDCYKVNPKVIEPYKAYSNVSSIYNKKTLLDSLVLSIFDKNLSEFYSVDT